MKKIDTPLHFDPMELKPEKKVIPFRIVLMLASWILLVLSGVLVSSVFLAGYLIRLQPIREMPIPLLMLLPIILSILLSMLLLTIWSGKTLRPLKQLTEATQKVREGDLTVRIPQPANQSELNQLIASFNLMLEELEHNEIFRKDFINNFSHEFKTPIVSIRGFARQLYNEDLTDEQKREYIDIIVAESDKLARMSANVLLLSKLENQTIVTDRSRFSLDEQLRDEILLLEPAWSKKELTISPELDSIDYAGSAELLSHVWRNLLSNAIKFSPVGGELRVDLYRREREILVSISDEGPGMDSETAARIFDKFYQGDTSHKSEGNGLGLSIAQRAVILCGGSIQVDSSPGCGCHITVRLPG